MIHGAVAVEAASALMVSSTESNDGCTAAASVQPPIMATGAAIADASAQRGTVITGAAFWSGSRRGSGRAAVRMVRAAGRPQTGDSPTGEARRTV